MYPLLRFNKQQILENTKYIVEKAAAHDISITAITKCAGGNHEIAETFIKGGASAIGDSRLKNLKDLQDFNCPKWLIRIPMLSEVNDTVLYSTLSLNSELKIIKALDEAAQKHAKKHDILLMVDLGDLREGYFSETDFFKDVESIRHLKNINLKGIGTNLSCTGAIVPTVETYEKFLNFQNLLKTNYDISCEITSGGATSSFAMLENGTLPPCINNLRIGELMLFGTDTSNHLSYANLHQNTFTLETEIIELKEKPSFPIGKIGRDAFGNIPSFEDKGLRKRALCALGKQDTTIDDLKPVDPKISIIASSSDHLLLDVTECTHPYDVGDIVSFHCNYSSALHASTSEYILKAAH
ncbi:MAG: alanine/ornithine racemase family PLP-dependent enzyme [Eubacterium sp.]